MEIYNDKKSMHSRRHKHTKFTTHKTPKNLHKLRELSHSININVGYKGKMKKHAPRLAQVMKSTTLTCNVVVPHNLSAK